MPNGILTSSTLIEEVKRSALIPSAQQTFLDADFLAFANQEMRIGLVPSIMQHHSEYYVRDSAPVPLVANQNAYSIPYRAIAGKLRDVYYLDTNNDLRSMTRISPDDRPFYQQSNFSNRFIYFYVQGNEIVLVPDVSANPTGSIVFTFYMRPNDLVDESRVATITSITDNGATITYTVDQVPTVFTLVDSHNNPIKYDLLQTKPGNKTYNFDITPTAIDTTNNLITFTKSDTKTATYGSNVGDTPIVGDYIALAGECIIPQAPAELHDVLSQRVVLRCLQALGDQAGYQVAQSKLAEQEKYLGTLTTNRTEGSPQKITNVSGLLRSSKIRRRGWLY